jgi:hypothetical protein
MEKTLYGLTAKNLRMMAFYVRIKNVISNTISGQDKTTKWKRFLKFLAQHSQLSLRKLRLTSAARTKTLLNLRTFSNIFI